jgi:hypothetical protein
VFSLRYGLNFYLFLDELRFQRVSLIPPSRIMSAITAVTSFKEICLNKSPLKICVGFSEICFYISFEFVSLLTLALLEKDAVLGTVVCKSFTEALI